MASNMKYCHICKAMAFVKVQLSSVVTLDCGHMAKLKGDDTAPVKKSKEDIQRERAEVRRYVPPPSPPKKIVVEEVKREPHVPRPGQPITTNVAGHIRDLLDGRSKK